MGVTGLDVFQRYAAAEAEIRAIDEKIERRRALISGATARPLSPDGGSRGGGDASMRLLDYMANMEEMETERAQRVRMRENDRACCVYLAEMLPRLEAEMAMMRYLDGKTLKSCAKALNYSETTARRILQDLNAMLRCIYLTFWDGEHIPVVAIVGS